MQTVKFNKRAVAILAATVLCFIVFVTFAASSSRDSGPKVVVRGNRRSVVEPGPGVAPVEARDEKPVEEPLEEVEPDLKKIEPDDTAANDHKAVLQHPASEDERAQKVREMMLHAWTGYKNYSWGQNEVRPMAKQPNSQAIFGGKDMPATIVDAADTLWIMGLTEQYNEARDYIREHFDMSKATGTLSVFETTIRFLGGMLSLYALTKEDFYIDKAKGIGEALLPAFNTPSGITKSNLDMRTKYSSNYGWANSGSSVLAEFGSLHLEFAYLARITKTPLFEKKVKKIRDHLDKMEKPDGLYPNYINPDTGKFTQPYHISLGAMGDSFYEYLIKSWLQTNKTDIQAHKMYWDVSNAIQEKMVLKSKSGLTYVAEMRGGYPEHKMGHLACFCVGMFALQAVNEKTPEKRESVMKLAEDLGNTCHEGYIRSASRIGPEMMYFNQNDDATSTRGEKGYILRPEVIEGYFYLWRLTGKKMYQDWVWDAVQAIEKYCKVEGGYTGLRDVYNPEAGRDDVQQSFFLAETLKYAYLSFVDNSVISLDKWVFNTEAHPLPVMDPSTP